MSKTNDEEEVRGLHQNISDQLTHHELDLEEPAAVGGGRKRAGIRDLYDGVAPPDVGFSVQGRRLQIYIGADGGAGVHDRHVPFRCIHMPGLVTGQSWARLEFNLFLSLLNSYTHKEYSSCGFL